MLDSLGYAAELTVADSTRTIVIIDNNTENVCDAAFVRIFFFITKDFVITGCCCMHQTPFTQASHSLSAHFSQSTSTTTPTIFFSPVSRLAKGSVERFLAMFTSLSQPPPPPPTHTQTQYFSHLPIGWRGKRVSREVSGYVHSSQ